jgi:hypothetical protein
MKKVVEHCAGIDNLVDYIFHQIYRVDEGNDNLAKIDNEEQIYRERSSNGHS